MGLEEWEVFKAWGGEEAMVGRFAAEGEESGGYVVGEVDFCDEEWRVGVRYL